MFAADFRIAHFGTFSIGGLLPLSRYRLSQKHPEMKRQSNDTASGDLSVPLCLTHNMKYTILIVRSNSDFSRIFLYPGGWNRNCGAIVSGRQPRPEQLLSCEERVRGKVD
jgi:hypothetical protein